MSDTGIAHAVGGIAVWPVELAPEALDDGGFVPLRDLDLDAAARDAATRLRAPVRVGHSAVVMGLASRLWSVSVVPFATHRVIVDPACVVVGRVDGSLQLGLREPRALADGDLGTQVDALVGPLVHGTPLAARLQWGNVAASLVAVPRVHRLPAARPVVAALMRRPELAGELDVVVGGRVRRRTCCLFYLAPGSGLCGDCVFDEPPATS